MAVAVFVGTGDAIGNLVGGATVGVIALNTRAIVGAADHADIAKARAEHGLLGDAIEDAPARATPEERPGRSLHDLDLLERRQVAVIFRVVAHAVDVDIVHGAEAANRRLIAPSLTELRHHAGNVRQRILHRQRRL